MTGVVAAIRYLGYELAIHVEGAPDHLPRLAELKAIARDIVAQLPGTNHPRLVAARLLYYRVPHTLRATCTLNSTELKYVIPGSVPPEARPSTIPTR